jgi:hypothetical protein
MQNNNKSEMKLSFHLYYKFPPAEPEYFMFIQHYDTVFIILYISG